MNILPIRKLVLDNARKEELRTAALLAEQAYGPKGPAKRFPRFLIQIAPDWELYLDSIDWGRKYRWTDDRSRAWSWCNKQEMTTRLAHVREKYPQALLVSR